MCTFELPTYTIDVANMEHTKVTIFFLQLLLSRAYAKSSVVGSDDEGWMTFEDLFLYGKDAYLANDWKKCASYFERAVEDYRTYNDKVNISLYSMFFTGTLYHVFSPG